MKFARALPGISVKLFFFLIESHHMKVPFVLNHVFLVLIWQTGSYLVHASISPAQYDVFHGIESSIKTSGNEDLLGIYLSDKDWSLDGIFQSENAGQKDASITTSYHQCAFLCDTSQDHSPTSTQQGHQSVHINQIPTENYELKNSCQTVDSVNYHSNLGEDISNQGDPWGHTNQWFELEMGNYPTSIHFPNSPEKRSRVNLASSILMDDQSYLAIESTDHHKKDDLFSTNFSVPKMTQESESSLKNTSIETGDQDNPNTLSGCTELVPTAFDCNGHQIFQTIDSGKQGLPENPNPTAQSIPAWRATGTYLEAYKKAHNFDFNTIGIDPPETKNRVRKREPLGSIGALRCSYPDVPIRQVCWLLEVEGSLVVGRTDGLSSKISQFLLQTIEKILGIQCGRQTKDEDWKYLVSKFESFKSNFLSAYFGGIYVLCAQNRNVNEHDVVMKAWVFLEAYLEKWSLVSLEQIESGVKEWKQSKRWDWSTPKNLLIYLVGLQQIYRYRQDPLLGLLLQFTQWNDSDQSCGVVKFDYTHFVQIFKSIYDSRKMRDALMETGLDDIPDIQDFYASKKSRKTLSNIKAKVFESISQDRNYGLNPTQNRSKFFDMTPEMKNKITDYFMELEASLCRNFLENPNAFHPSFYLKVSNHSTQSGKDRVKQAIESASKIITPVVFEMVMSLHNNQGGNVRLDIMIEHAWKFLQAYFSKWEKCTSQGMMTMEALWTQSGTQTAHVDWSDSHDTLHYFMTHSSTIKTPINRCVWYLARQWQCLWSQDVHQS